MSQLVFTPASQLARMIRDRIVVEMDRSLDAWDAYLCPVAATTAFTHRPQPKRHSSRSKTLFSSPFFHAVIDGYDDLKPDLGDSGCDCPAETLHERILGEVDKF